MKMCCLLILFFVLWDGAGLTGAETVTAAEGQDIRVSCWFVFPGKNKILCKNDCKNKENILVETSGSIKYKGRYSIEYEEKRVYIMHVRVKNVTKSDAGRYQCVMERSIKNGNHEFNIDFTKDAFSSNANFILKPTLLTTIGPTTKQNSTNTPHTSSQSEHEQQPTTAAPLHPAANEHSYLLLQLLVPVIMVVLLLICCKTRNSQNDAESTGKTRGVNTEIAVQSFSAPVSVSEDCTYQSLSVDTRDSNQIYSTITALP